MQIFRPILATFLALAVSLMGHGIASAQTGLPPECVTRQVTSLSAIRNGLLLQRMQINQISLTILRNSSGDPQVRRLVSGPLRRQADKALEQALRALSAFPEQIISCIEPTECVRQSLEEERIRLLSAARKLSNVAHRIVNRFPDLLGEPAIFVHERIDSVFNALLDGFDFLPPFTYVCPRRR